MEPWEIALHYVMALIMPALFVGNIVFSVLNKDITEVCAWSFACFYYYKLNSEELKMLLGFYSRKP